LGGFLGIVLASACLKFKIGEDLLGAWQLGWPIIGSFHSMLAFGFLFLPHRLPTSQEVELKDQEETFRLSFPDNDKIEIEESIWDVWLDLKRLFKNQTLMFDSLAMSFFLFSVTNWSYISKFVEF
jgi:hypothetical protein